MVVGCAHRKEGLPLTGYARLFYLCYYNKHSLSAGTWRAWRYPSAVIPAVGIHEQRLILLDVCRRWRPPARCCYCVHSWCPTWPRRRTPRRLHSGWRTPVEGSCSPTRVCNYNAFTPLDLQYIPGIIDRALLPMVGGSQRRCIS